MPFENPTALSNFVELLFDPPDPGRADRDLRADGRQPPPGLGDLRRDVILLLVGIGVSYGGEQPDRPHRTPPVSRPRPTAPTPAATWRARSSASASLPRPNGPRRRRRPRTAPSTPPSTPTPASAGLRPGQHADRRGDLRRGCGACDGAGPDRAEPGARDDHGVPRRGNCAGRHRLHQRPRHLDAGR